MNKNKEVTQKEPKKNKKEGFWKRFAKGCSNMFAELKKVSWPKFNKVIKQTSVVLGVVLFFLVVVTVFDFGLQALLTLLTSNSAG